MANESSGRKSSDRTRRWSSGKINVNELKSGEKVIIRNI